MDREYADSSYGIIEDYQPSRGSGIGLEASTLISVLAFLAFLLHAFLIVLIPWLKSCFSSPLVGYGYGNGIGYGNGMMGSGINNGGGGVPGMGYGMMGSGINNGGGGGGVPGMGYGMMGSGINNGGGGVPGMGLYGFGVPGGGSYGSNAGFSYGIIPTILGGVNGILGTGLSGVATNVGKPSDATTNAVAARTLITEITRVIRSQDNDDKTRLMWHSEHKQIKPTSKVDESAITSQNV